MSTICCWLASNVCVGMNIQIFWMPSVWERKKCVCLCLCVAAHWSRELSQSVCVCVWRRQRYVHLVETCRGVPHCADTWHRALAQTQTHSMSECVCDCVFEGNRECVSGVIVWCVCQHVVSVSTLEMHMFICVEDSSFFISFKLMCFCMCSEVCSFFFFSLNRRCQKLVIVRKQSFLSLQLSVVIWKAQCRALVAYLHYCCLPFLFLTGSLPV